MLLIPTPRNCSLRTLGSSTLRYTLIFMPKLQYLTDYGIVGPLLAELMVVNPFILRRSLSVYIKKPTFEFLEKYVHKNDNVVAHIMLLCL